MEQPLQKRAKVLPSQLSILLRRYPIMESEIERALNTLSPYTKNLVTRYMDLEPYPTIMGAQIRAIRSSYTPHTIPHYNVIRGQVEAQHKEWRKCLVYATLINLGLWYPHECQSIWCQALQDLDETEKQHATEQPTG